MQKFVPGVLNLKLSTIARLSSVHSIKKIIFYTLRVIYTFYIQYPAKKCVFHSDDNDAHHTQHAAPSLSLSNIRHDS